MFAKKTADTTRVNTIGGCNIISGEPVLVCQILLPVVCYRFMFVQSVFLQLKEINSRIKLKDSITTVAPVSTGPVLISNTFFTKTTSSKTVNQIFLETNIIPKTGFDALSYF